MQRQKTDNDAKRNNNIQSYLFDYSCLQYQYTEVLNTESLVVVQVSKTRFNI